MASKDKAKESGKAWSSAYVEQARERAQEMRRIQKDAEARRSKRKKEQESEKKKEEKPVQLADRKLPEPPMPEQHLTKPGVEADLAVRPEYEAPTYRGSEKLLDKVALITGGDSGIGRSVAVLFAREGADIAVVYLDEDEDAEETKRAVEAEGRRCILIPGDVTDSGFCRAAVEHTVVTLGKLDILVNNAAFQERQLSLEDITDEQLDITFRTNIYGYFFMARAALKYLGKGGIILNTGSVTGDEGHKELLDYAATKGAIHNFTKSLSQNLIKKGIRVNCVAPGPVWTPLNPADADADEVKDFGKSVPMKRPAQPEEIAPAFVFLAAASDSSYITGDIIAIYGGDPT
jgi:NAD(P)-dependent dehydrogenase (short-subunit alcohol dehydrogenase family)